MEYTDIGTVAARCCWKGHRTTGTERKCALTDCGDELPPRKRKPVNMGTLVGRTRPDRSYWETLADQAVRDGAERWERWVAMGWHAPERCGVRAHSERVARGKARARARRARAAARAENGDSEEGADDRAAGPEVGDVRRRGDEGGENRGAGCRRRIEPDGVPELPAKMGAEQGWGHPAANEGGSGRELQAEARKAKRRSRVRASTEGEEEEEEEEEEECALGGGPQAKRTRGNNRTTENRGAGGLIHLDPDEPRAPEGTGRPAGTDGAETTIQGREEKRSKRRKSMRKRPRVLYDSDDE
jgi:hypothetical protein